MEKQGEQLYSGDPSTASLLDKNDTYLPSQWQVGYTEHALDTSGFRSKANSSGFGRYNGSSSTPTRSINSYNFGIYPTVRPGSSPANASAFTASHYECLLSDQYQA